MPAATTESISLWDLMGGEMPPVIQPIIPATATHYGDPGPLPVGVFFEPYISQGSVDSVFQTSGTSYEYKNSLRGEQSWSEWARANKNMIYAGVATVALLAYMKGR